MVGLVLAGHGGASEALVGAAEMIVGEQANIRALNLRHDTNLDVFDEDLQHAVAEVDDGDGVLVLCDLFGGSPANTASRLIVDGCHVVTGVNLPMLLEVLGRRAGASLAELAQVAREAGCAGVIDVNELLLEGGEA